MSRSDHPPGPQLSPLGPGIWRLLRDPFGELLQIAADYEDIALIRIGPLKICLLNHPRYVKDVLVTRQREFIKGGAFHLARSILGDGLLTSDGDFHLRQRRLAQPAFHPPRIAGYARMMIECTRQTREAWRHGQVIDVFREMSHTTLTIAAATLFGAAIETRTDEVREALTDVLHNWKQHQLPLAHVLHRLKIPFPANRRLRRARARLDAIIYELIDRQKQLDEPRDDLLSRLICAVDDGTRMTDLQLRDEAMTFMLAGHETMATTLSWAWYLVSQHPRVSERLYAEADHVLGRRDAVPEDLPSLAYARQVFAEALRLYPALWNFTRRALHDVRLEPYTIPAGCQVMVCPYVVHRNPTFFAEPLRFDPDRWAPGGPGEQLPDLAYLPFGGGVRRCIGEPFAWAEGPLVLATLAQRWRLEFVRDERPVEPVPAFICRPRHPLRFRLVERRGEAAALASLPEGVSSDGPAFRG